MYKDFVLADTFVLSNAGEQDLPDQEKFTKILNNSFALSEEQFATLHAMATGKVDTTTEELSITLDTFDNCYFLFQGGQKAKEAGAAPWRDHMIIMAVNVVTKKTQRIFVRAPRGNGAALDKLLSYFRPQHFIRDLMDLLEKGAQIVAVDRPRPAPNRNKPGGKGGKPEFRQNRGSSENAPGTFGDRWPGKEGRGDRKQGGNKDRRYSADD